MSCWVGQAIAASALEDKLCRNILFLCQRGLDKAEALAYKELNKLLEDEKGPPITYGHDQIESAWGSWYNNLQKSPKSRMSISNTPSRMLEPAEAIGNRFTVDIDKEICEEVMAELDAYYKV